jgi:transcriptional regulator with XRE-family HTH domain
MEDLKDRIKHLRNIFEVGSQEKLAEILKVNGARVKSIETGRVKDLTAQEANILVKKFNLNIDWLLTGKGDMLQDTAIDTHTQLSQQEAEIVQDYRVLEKDDQDIFYHELKTAALKARKKAKDTNLKDN